MSDIFRVAYRELSTEEKDLCATIKEKASELLSLMEKTADGRYRALARTSLEQAVMWSIKGITQ